MSEDQINSPKSEVIQTENKPETEDAPVDSEQYAKATTQFIDKSSTSAVDSGNELLESIKSKENPDSTDSDLAATELAHVNAEIFNSGKEAVTEIAAVEASSVESHQKTYLNKEQFDFVNEVNIKCRDLAVEASADVHEFLRWIKELLDKDTDPIIKEFNKSLAGDSSSLLGEVSDLLLSKANNLIETTSQRQKGKTDQSPIPDYRDFWRVEASLSKRIVILARQITDSFKTNPNSTETASKVFDKLNEIHQKLTNKVQEISTYYKAAGYGGLGLDKEELMVPSNEELSIPTENNGQQTINSKSVESNTESSDNNINIAKWLKELNLEQVDPELAQLFQKALLERAKNTNENSDQDLLEIAHLVEALPKVLSNVTKRVKELSSNKELYSNIEKKQAEIIRGFCLPVINKHFTAEDLLTLSSEIQIISKNNPPKELALGTGSDLQGYEGVMFYHDRVIYLFEESLVDNFVTKDGTALNLNIQHMLTHEISHPFVEAFLSNNKILLEKCNELIENAEELKDSQSLHIRNVLDGIMNVNNDFEKYFADNLLNSKAYQELDENSKIVFKETNKASFITNRKQIAVAEIMTEYTAMYLQSDSNFDSFVINCLESTYTNEPEKAFGISSEKLRLLLSKKNQSESLSELIEKESVNNPKFKKVLGIYKTFFTEAKNAIAENKGRVSEAIDSDGEIDFSDGYYEDASNFNQSGSDNNKGEGFWQDFIKFIGAFSEEIDITKSVVK